MRFWRTYNLDMCQCGHYRFITLIALLACLSPALFALNDAAAALSDLENIKPTSPSETETESDRDNTKESKTDSSEQDESVSDGENTNESIMSGSQAETQDGTQSGITDTETYPTEDAYCKINIVEHKQARQGYVLKFGTNNNDKLSGTPNSDLIFGLDGNDIIYGLEGGDIICGGNGNDVIYGDPESSSSSEIPKGDLPKSWSQDLIFGQDGDDTIYGGAGSDIIQGGIGEDSLYGHNGVWTGGQGIHNDGNDLIDGGPGDDGCHDHQLKTFLNCEYTSDAIVK